MSRIQLSLFDEPAAPAVATTEELNALLAQGAPVAIGVSGGKDSTAVAFATLAHLNSIGHTGPRVLVHADLGVTEWADSLPACRRLAQATGCELVVVRRPKGDMMDRWEQRHADNVRRWEALECVKLILPWSTPDMRFCTSELKVDQITRELSKRFPNQTIINVTGVRRDESRDRRNAPTCSTQPKLTSKTNNTTGRDWNPIADWNVQQVWDIHEANGFDRHEAYTAFGSSRVSCVFCILATVADHLAGASDPRNVTLALRMIDLETRSTFALQGSRWLGDTLAHLLSQDERDAHAQAKRNGELRALAETKIPAHLLFEKGWPKVMPTDAEAITLAAVRWQVADVCGLQKTFTKPADLIERYRELIAEKARKDVEKAEKEQRKAARSARK